MSQPHAETVDPPARGLFDQVPTALLLVDGTERVFLANRRAARILGRDAAALEGQRLDEVLGPLDLPRAGESESSPYGREASPPGRPELVIGYSASPLSGDGHDGWAIVFQDITPLERLRQERDRLLQLAAVGETLPAVLHEIKNPLAAVTTAVEVLLEELEEGHARRELRAVLGEVRRMKLALEGVGLFRNDLRAPRLAVVDNALREAWLVVEPQLRAKGVQGELRVAALPPMPLDATVMRAFLFNLVTNALHACESGDRITVSAARLEDGGVLELAVEDTGCGMTPEVLARCRELFFTTKSNGSGIGLALCHGVVTRAGGSLEIDSEPGRGTRVALRIPVGGAPGPGARAAQVTGPGPGGR